MSKRGAGIGSVKRSHVKKPGYVRGIPEERVSLAKSRMPSDEKHLTALKAAIGKYSEAGMKSHGSKAHQKAFDDVMNNPVYGIKKWTKSWSSGDMKTKKYVNHDNDFGHGIF